MKQQLIQWGLAVGVTLITAQTQAQMNSPELRSFVAGQSNLIESAGLFIADICDELDAVANNRDQNEEALSTACTQLANNAQRLNDNEALQANDLTASELLDAIEQVSPEEVAAIASGFTDTAQDQLASVANRQAFLRTGLAQGFALNWGQTNGGAAGDEASKLGFFVNSNYGFGDKDDSAQEAGFDYDAFGLTAGVDYRFDDEWVGGVALSFSQSEVDFDQNGGDTESDGFNLTFYGSHYWKEYYFDAVLGFGSYSYDNTRNINVLNEVATSDTDADSISYSLGAGFAKTHGDWNNNYFARIDGVMVDIDGYTETGSFLAMEVQDQDVDSMQLIVGAQATRTFSRDWGIAVPYAGLELRYELDDDTRVVTASYAFDRFGDTFSFQSDDADSSYGVISLGSNFVLSQGRQVFVNYDRVIGLNDVNGNTLTAGFRMEL